MAKKNLDELSRKYRFDRSSAKRSQEWFRKKVYELKDQTSARTLLQNPARRQDYMIPGQMYMYMYNPIGAETLPYYDTFPLVIPFSRDAETFTGLNFHYLPYKMRAMLLANLLEFATDPKLNAKSRLVFQWQYVSGVSKFIGVSSAVKKYRFDCMQSHFTLVPADQWFNAIMLPVEQFRVGKVQSVIDKNVVWLDSMRYV